MKLQTLVQDLESYRDRHNLTQAALAEILGVPRPTLANWLAGNFNPRFKTLLKIEQLFEEEDNNGKHSD